VARSALAELIDPDHAILKSLDVRLSKARDSNRSPLGAEEVLAVTG
jgi:hypothetical protein